MHRRCRTPCLNSASGSLSLATGACRGVKALTTVGAEIMDDILPRYEEARSWRRIEVTLGKFFQHEALAVGARLRGRESSESSCCSWLDCGRTR